MDAPLRIAALSNVVLRLCGQTQCSDYSQSECEFYLRYDTLTWARLSEGPGVCFAAVTSELRPKESAAFYETCFPRIAP